MVSTGVRWLCYRNWHWICVAWHWHWIDVWTVFDVLQWNMVGFLCAILRNIRWIRWWNCEKYVKIWNFRKNKLLSEPTIRGTMLAIGSMSTTSGNFFIFLLGSFIPWRNVALFCAVTPIMTVLFAYLVCIEYEFVFLACILAHSLKSWVAASPITISDAATLPVDMVGTHWTPLDKKKIITSREITHGPSKMIKILHFFPFS